ncbi:MAG TPA: S8 family serine peptidase [Candidatus Binatia bacterium]|nr:S8 family serine peptidase [Candidatus Binatia bacterium]
MKRSWKRHFIEVWLLLLWLGLMAGTLAAVVARTDGGPAPKKAGADVSFKEGEVLVKFKSRLSPTDTARLARELGADTVREFPFLSQLRQSSYLLIAASQRSTRQLLDDLGARSEVEAVSPNFRRRLQRLPNDPKLGQLWGLQKIDAAAAWEMNTGAPEVVLAVLDSGVDYLHEDLAANMWVNPGEVAGNGVDDDGNGFVDDVHGYDFAADNQGGRDNDPMDIDSHGSHVAGTIAAAGDNGAGVCGVNWNVQIMALKCSRPDESIFDSDTIAAMEYAVRMKKDFGVNLVAINASFGGGGENPVEKDIIAAAGEQNIILVCAAGNNGMDNETTPFFPAGYDLPNIISVAATAADDELADFSNYGVNSVDIAAPGVAILSTVRSGMGSEATLISGAISYQAIPMEFAGSTPAAGLVGQLVDCGLGLDSTFFPAAVTGNIALIERGEKTFQEKALNAQAAGAVAAVIYNNEEGNFSGTLGDAGNWIPVMSLARQDGLAEKALGLHPVTFILAPGNYEFMDGTSMAAPHVCGAVGLLAAQYPADATSKLVARIVTAADPVQALNGKIKSGARLNLARALAQKLLLALAVFRRQVDIWVLKKDFAQVFFSAENDPASGVSAVSYGIYRSRANGGLQLLKEIAASELQNNAYTYYDKYLDRGVTYSYQVQAKNAGGEIIAVSNQQSI